MEAPSASTGEHALDDLRGPERFSFELARVIHILTRDHDLSFLQTPGFAAPRAGTSATIRGLPDRLRVSALSRRPKCEERTWCSSPPLRSTPREVDETALGLLPRDRIWDSSASCQGVLPSVACPLYRRVERLGFEKGTPFGAGAFEGPHPLDTLTRGPNPRGGLHRAAAE